MWSIASQAGTGVAIVGLSATYYALIRKNMELERRACEAELTSTESFDDDNEQQEPETPNRGDMGTQKLKVRMPTLPASQTLLKKNFEELGRTSGSIGGLNLAYLTDGASVQAETTSSEIEVRHIVSRVDTLSLDLVLKRSRSLSNVHKYKSAEDISSLTANQVVSMFSCVGSVEQSKSQFDVETFSRLEISEEILDVGVVETLDILPAELKSEETQEIPEKEPPVANKVCCCQDSIEDASIEDVNILEVDKTQARSKSPVIYFSNPRYGQRFACKDELSKGFASFPDESSPRRDENSTNEEIEVYKDSTEFIFPPILSESQMSLYEDENKENDLVDEEILQDPEAPNPDIAEILDYNLQLDKNGNGIFSEVSSTETSFIPHSPVCSTKLSTSIYQNAQSLPVYGWSADSNSKINEEPVSVVSSPEASMEPMHHRDVATTVPSTNAWISELAAQTIRNTPEIPWLLILFIVCVTVIVGCLGSIFIWLSNLITPAESYEEMDESFFKAEKSCEEDKNIF